MSSREAQAIQDLVATKTFCLRRVAFQWRCSNRLWQLPAVFSSAIHLGAKLCQSVPLNLPKPHSVLLQREFRNSNLLFSLKTFKGAWQDGAGGKDPCTHVRRGSIPTSCPPHTRYALAHTLNIKHKQKPFGDPEVTS